MDCRRCCARPASRRRPPPSASSGRPRGRCSRRSTRRLAEVREALDGGDRAHVAEEIGDLLFAVSNLARKLDHDPEALLRAATRKFAGRFRAMETRLADAGTPVGSDAATLDVMEAAWQAGKAR